MQTRGGLLPRATGLKELEMLDRQENWNVMKQYSDELFETLGYEITL